MRLLVTEESGRLARWLRLMGHDAATRHQRASRFLKTVTEASGHA